MDFTHFIVTYILVLQLPYHVFSIRTPLENNFYKELESYEVQITKELNQELQSVEVKSYKTYWEELWHQSLGANLPTAVDMFGRVYIIQKEQILELLLNTPAVNETVILKETLQLCQECPIKFVRTIKWKAVLYILVCYETEPCSLYTGTSDMRLTHRQKIKTTGLAMDASFFTQKNRLYLIVADYIKQSAAFSMIYHWNSTYMDVATKIETSGAVSVTTFNYKQWTIIIFGQNDPENGLKVYEFGNNMVNSIQCLPTSKPVSVHHFSHGIMDYVLVINEDSPGKVLWFRSGKNKKFMLLHESPPIGPSSLAKIINFGSETFALIACRSTLELFAISGMSGWVHVDNINIIDGEDIIDLGIQTSGAIMNIVVVTQNSREDTYSVHVWKLRITEDLQVDARVSDNAPTKCFADLVSLLKSRLTDIDEARVALSALYSPNENVTIVRELRLPRAHFELGSAETVQIIISEKIARPMKIQERFDNIQQEMEELFLVSDRVPRYNENNNITVNVMVDGHVFSDVFNTRSLDATFINEQNINLGNLVSSTVDQHFTTPLKGKYITAHCLEVESICGIPFKFWYIRDHASKTSLPDIQSGVIRIINDTVFVNSDVSLKLLITEQLNDIDVDKLLSEIFIVGQQQKIEGSVAYRNEIKIVNLKVGVLNDVPMEEILSKTTEQRFNEFSVKNVEITDLHADFIDDIAIDEVARISRGNVIKGHVTLANLHVTDELNIQTANVAIDHRPKQIYDNVVITGNLAVGNVNIQSGRMLYLNNVTLNHGKIFKEHWIKSEEQTIKENVVFTTGIIINRLNTQFINRSKEDDFLYTTVEEIPEKFAMLHFENVHVSTILAEGENKKLFTIGEELAINRPLHLKRLNASNLLTNIINDMPVDYIINVDTTVKINENMHLIAMRVRTINVDNFDIDFLNEKNILDHGKSFLLVDDYVRMQFMEMAKLTVRHLIVEILNDINITYAIDLNDMNRSHLEDIIIHGDLIVEKVLEVNAIGGLLPEEFLGIFMQKDIIIANEQAIDTLAVLNLTGISLHGLLITNFLPDLLSKSKNQTFLDQFSFAGITASHMYAKYINDQANSKLVWIDEPIYIVSNITITNLLVDGDIDTKCLNGHNVTQVYNDLRTIPTTKIDDLRVNGSVSWTASRDSTDSLTYLLKNAVTKTTDQNISGTVTFNESIHIATFIGEFEGIQEIRPIITDAVIDNGNIIAVLGNKTFKQNLSTDSLNVAENVGIMSVNDRDIIEVNNSMVRKYKDSVIQGPVIFCNEVSIVAILTNETVIHGGSITELSLTNGYMPDNVVFQDLYIQGNGYLKDIDDIDFDEFAKHRFTLNETHAIQTTVQFNGLIEVTGNAVIETMNGTTTSDMVINSSIKPQVISGAKTFVQDVIVNESVDVRHVNSINVSAAFENGVVNDKNMNIFGDLVFESTVTILDNITVTGLVNDVDLSTRIRDLNILSDRTLSPIMDFETIIYEKMYHAKAISETLPNHIFYFEEEQNVTIDVLPIKEIDMTQVGEPTYLNLYGQQNGNACELPADCNCVVQYIIELFGTNRKISKLNGFTITWTFREPGGAFNVIVETNVTSHSKKCTHKNFANQFASIWWVTTERSNADYFVGSRKCIEQNIRGYLKDVQFFLYNDIVYIAMAMFYNVENTTHQTYSPVYKLNLNNESLSLVQSIPTLGGWSIEIFQIDDEDEIYMLIGCHGSTAESLLYEFDKTILKFIFVRSFPVRSRFVKSVSYNNNYFFLLDDSTVNSVQIYKYNAKVHSFYHYQSLHFDSPVSGIECFYASEYKDSDAYILVTTEGGQFFVYEYMLYNKFQLAKQHWLDDVQGTTLFSHGSGHYILSIAKSNSTIFRIVQQGPK